MNCSSPDYHIDMGNCASSDTQTDSSHQIFADTAPAIDYCIDGIKSIENEEEGVDCGGNCLRCKM
jgi:hypothetical protein